MQYSGNEKEIICSNIRNYSNPLKVPHFIDKKIYMDYDRAGLHK